MSKLSVEQQNLIQELRQAYPEELQGLSDEQILTIYNEQLSAIKLNEDQQVSVMGLDLSSDESMGLALQSTTQLQIKQLNEEEKEHLKQTLLQRITVTEDNANAVRAKNGFFQKLWSGMKNGLNIGDSSEDVVKAKQEELKILSEKNIELAFKEITGQELTEENYTKFLNSELKTKSEQALDAYTEGQEMVHDTLADMGSGILSFVAYTAAVAAAPATGGLSIAAGVALATATGAGMKTWIKKSQAKKRGEEYTTKNMKDDLITGAVSGILAPFTGGAGSAVGKTLAVKCFGMKVFKQAGKELVEEGLTSGFKQGFKNAMLNAAGYEYKGSTLGMIVAYGSEMATDGALSGMVENGFRAAYEGGDAKDVLGASISGFGSGLVLSPVIGGGMRGAGKVTRTAVGFVSDKIHKSIPKFNFDIRNADSFFKAKGFSEDEIAQFKEAGVYNVISTYLQVYEKHCTPEDFNKMIGDCKEVLASKNFDGLPKVSDYTVDNINEILSITKTCFPNLSDDGYITLVLEDIMTRDEKSVKYILDILKNNPEVFANVKKETFVYKIFDDLIETKEPEILAKKLEMLKFFNKTDKDYVLNQVASFLKEVDEIDYRYNIMKAYENDKNFEGKFIDLFLNKKHETIDYILKTYEETKAVSKESDKILDDLLRITDNNLEEKISVRDFAKKLREECGITDKIDDYVLLMFKKRINNEHQLAYIKEFYEDCGKDFKAIENTVYENISIIQNKAQKDLMRLDDEYKLFEYYSDRNCVELITEEWQVATAKILLDLGCRNTDVVQVLLKNNKKEINDYIHKKIKSGADIQKIIKDIAYYSQAYVNNLPKFEGTKMESYLCFIDENNEVLFEKLASMDDKDFLINNLQDIGYFFKKIGSDTSDIKAKLVVDYIENGHNLADFEKMFIQNSYHHIFDHYVEMANNVYKTKLFSKLEFPKDEWLLEHLAKFDNEEVVDKIISYTKSHDIKSPERLCDLFSPDTKVAKAQFEFLEDILKVEPDYLEKNCSFSGIATPMFEAGSSVDDIIAKHEWFNKMQTRNDYPKDKINNLICSITDQNKDFVEELLTHPRFADIDCKNDIWVILSYTNKINLDLARKLVNDKKFPMAYIFNILAATNATNIKLTEELCANRKFPKNCIAQIISRIGNLSPFLPLAEKLCFDDEFPKQLIPPVLSSFYVHCDLDTSDFIKFAERLCLDKDFPKSKISNVLAFLRSGNLDLAEKLCFDKNFPKDYIEQIINRTHNYNKDIAEKLCFDKDFPKEKIHSVLLCITEKNYQYAKDICSKYKQMELSVDDLIVLLETYGQISPKQYRKLKRIIGSKKLSELTNNETIVAAQMIDLCGVKNINEISIIGKKDLLKNLVSLNAELFNVSAKIKAIFPLLPTNLESYCELLPSIVRSLGIETNTLSQAQVTSFNKSLSSLSDVLAKVSDEDFANLKITQEYTKEDFIQNVLRIVKGMDRAERQKVYDYFGFELHHNKKTQSGFSITGYPVNLNNGKKLAQISDPRTKEIVELLRPEVIRFSEKNPVRCSIPGLKPLLDEILDVLPELRAQIGKIQHDTHSFDVFQHSLKVMQKISQDVNFKTLNESDQKIMMLASLLHDITKLEKYSDGTHAAQGAFDAMYIAKKFNLTREEEIKLYTLSRHHEWLQYVNTSHSEKELIKRIQSVAYDLQNDNLFDMALMFTHADLRAVKKSDIFHDTIDGDSRILLDGKTRRSYGASADIYAKQIKEAIAELKKSQPFLPVTKIPSASRVAEAITKVKADGSTNIKGVYKDKDGLIILKFNEIEDWEAIGFPRTHFRCQAMRKNTKCICSFAKS